jgi:hypothetical protein
MPCLTHTVFSISNPVVVHSKRIGRAGNQLMLMLSYPIGKHFAGYHQLPDWPTLRVLSQPPPVLFRTPPVTAGIRPAQQNPKSSRTLNGSGVGASTEFKPET